MQDGFYNENTEISTTEKLWHINIDIECFMINLEILELNIKAAAFIRSSLTVALTDPLAINHRQAGVIDIFSLHLAHTLLIN